MSNWKLSFLAFSLMFSGLGAACAAQPVSHTTHVVVVMIDGMRWEEVFNGADAALLQTKGPDALGGSDERNAYARQHYGVADRARLMPFLWNVVARQGQLFGNRPLGSDSHVTNGLNFSYPGYSETLVGIADPRVHSNDNTPNPNATVFEWLNKRPGFEGKVAAFGAWEVFDGIFNKQRCGFPVNASYEPLSLDNPSGELNLLNQLKQETVRIWGDEAFDPLPFHTAVEYVKAKKPRVLFLGLGETDDWAHSGSYAEYLNAANRSDRYIESLWNLLQSMPEYHDQTTLIVLPDHGRGLGAEWTSHGEKIPASRETWMAFLGPDTAALGERKGNVTPVTESQVAATVAALLGENYHGAVPQTGAPIADVLPR